MIVPIQLSQQKRGPESAQGLYFFYRAAIAISPVSWLSRLHQMRVEGPGSFDTNPQLISLPTVGDNATGVRRIGYDLAP